MPGEAGTPCRSTASCGGSKSRGKWRGVTPRIQLACRISVRDRTTHRRRLLLQSNMLILILLSAGTILLVFMPFLVLPVAAIGTLAAGTAPLLRVVRSYRQDSE
jgi:hypothetical protein